LWLSSRAQIRAKWKEALFQLLRSASILLLLQAGVEMYELSVPHQSHGTDHRLVATTKTTTSIFPPRHKSVVSQPLLLLSERKKEKWLVVTILPQPHFLQKVDFIR
jgi:hypothetical protein